MTKPNTRDSAIDVTRGLAVLLMVQTHLYDGWVADDARASFGFGITRLLGIFPLPSFLLLAGVGLAMRIRAGERRGEEARAVHRDLAVRGLRVVAAGYAVSALLGLLDGARDVATYVRSDVLHAIGLSLVLASLVALPWRGKTTSGRTLASGLGIVALAALLLVPGTRTGRAATGVARYLLAPFVEVPGLTRMPVIPLVAWLGLGMVLGATFLREPRSRGARIRLALFSAAVSSIAFVAMHALHARLGGTLDRTHPAAFANLVDLGGRAVFLLAATMSIADGLPRTLRDELARLGRHSLLAYAVHLPFAYGRPVRAFLHRSDLPTASLGLVALVAFTVIVVRVYDSWEAESA